jgi:hypothetical protein
MDQLQQWIDAEGRDRACGRDRGVMRIDVHAHYWTEDYLDLLVDPRKADAGEARGLGAGDVVELEARLRPMDGAGVVMQVPAAAQLQAGALKRPRGWCPYWSEREALWIEDREPRSLPD